MKKANSFSLTKLLNRAIFALALVCLALLIISAATPSFAKYATETTLEGSTRVAKVVVSLKESGANARDLEVNEEYEYGFTVGNYLNSEISEVAVEYSISINSNNNYVSQGADSFKLYSVDNDGVRQAVALTDSRTRLITMGQDGLPAVHYYVLVYRALAETDGEELLFTVDVTASQLN